MQIFICCKTIYLFRVSQHPSSGVLKTVPAASGTSHNTGNASPLQRDLIRTRWNILHVGTVETQRYAFLLFSITTVNTGVFFSFRAICLLHATTCRHRELFCVKLIAVLSSELSFRKEIPFISLTNACLWLNISMFCKVRKFSSYRAVNCCYVRA